MELKDGGEIVWDPHEFDDLYKDRRDDVAAVLLPDLIWYPVDDGVVWTDKFSDPKYGGQTYFWSNGTRFELFRTSVLAKRLL